MGPIVALLSSPQPIGMRRISVPVLPLFRATSRRSREPYDWKCLSLKRLGVRRIFDPALLSRSNSRLSSSTMYAATGCDFRAAVWASVGSIIAWTLERERVFVPLFIRSQAALHPCPDGSAEFERQKSLSMFRAKGQSTQSGLYACSSDPQVQHCPSLKTTVQAWHAPFSSALLSPLS